MDLLEEQLSYKFRNPELVQQALTYTTFQTPTSSPFNTRKRTCDHLKILGDTVIKLLTSQYAVCVSLPNDKVHKIVRIKDNLSNRYTQNTIGKRLELEEKGLIVTSLQHEQLFSHLDVFVKSLFGAIFIDAGGSEKKGFVSCWKTFLKLWKPVISTYDEAKPLIACFPEPKFSSQEFLKERFSNFKPVDLKLLEEKIGFKFLKQPHLLEQAMTHDSIEQFRSSSDSADTAYPHRPEFVHFQTLEFLGDSVLELVIMEYLYLRSSSADPLGQMLFFNRDTGQKLVSSRFQIQVANNLKLENFVIKPPGRELLNNDDFVESLIGSIYIHAKFIGLRACAKIVLEMWGLEPSLQEEEERMIEDKKQNGPKDVVNKEKIENGVDKTVNKAEPKAPQSSTSTPAPSSKSSPVKCDQSPHHKELQTVLDYKFVNTHLLNYLPVKINDSTSTDDAKDSSSLNAIHISSNLQVIGKRAIELTIAEYVIGICHSSKTADLSAEMKRSVTKLMEDLAGEELLSDIFARLKLSKYFNLQEKVPNPTRFPWDVLYVIFGAVFVDSSGNLLKIQKLFLRLWQNYTNGATPEANVINWFPDTSEKQQIFRGAINAKISDAMWIKMAMLMGHTFTHKNLLEQALTDEKSQGYAKQVHDAYPLGNPFGLQIIGKRIMDLFSAQTCYINTLSEPGNFTGVLQRFDQSLYNTLKSRFHNLERYYANHIRYPFPPKKNARAPYEAMMAALYLDVGGGMAGMQQIHFTISKASAPLLCMKKVKGVQKISTSESGIGECSASDGGKDSEDEPVANSKSPELPSKSPLKNGNSKNAQEILNTSFGSQDSTVSGGGRLTPLTPLPPVAVPLVGQDSLLSDELQTKLGYKFVNPLLLKIVLEVDIAIPVNGKGSDSETVSKNHFEMFKILGKRALNLLVTEFALESLPTAKNADISDIGKKQVENHLKHLSSPLVIDMVSNSLELNKYTFASAKKGKTASPSNEDFITALLGAIFIDSRANYLKISALFNKLWKSNISPVAPHSRLAQCFISTTEGQLKFRNATGAVHTDIQWNKLYEKLAYKFKNRNLLEQALTDEKSQELARTKHKAYPTGNPFALRLLGRCAVDLVMAYKTLPSELSTQVDTYVAALNLLDKSLFNSFKNNFLGTERYYAWIKQKKNQPFPPKSDPLGPYEAMVGAVFVDAGAGNPGLDTVGVVIANRNIGVKGSKPSIGILNILPVQPTVNFPPSSSLVPVSESIAVATTQPISCSTPTPSTSSASAHSESPNTSFSSKCAANFSISPVQPRNSPLKPKPVKPTIVEPSSISPPVKPTIIEPNSISPPVKPTIIEPNSSSPPVKPAIIEPSPISPPVSQQKKLPSASPSKSPKKLQKQQQQQQKSYASALINGQPVKTDNKLIIAVTNAQSQIQALKKKQESKDHYRKLSIEREKALQQDQDQASSTSSSRSRCPSTSTVTSVGSQQQPLSEPGQKRKRGRNASKKQNKKAKAANNTAKASPSPAKKAAVTPQQIMAMRVSNWCQSQLDGMPSSSSSPLTGVPSSCTSSEAHQQRSMVVHQQDNSGVGRGEVDIPEEISSQFSSPTHSTHNSHVPVNMVCGYRKSAEDDYRSTRGSGATPSKGKTNQNQNGGCSTSRSEDATSDPPTGFSYFGILKWTSLILGVAFLLKRYSQGK